VPRRRVQLRSRKNLVRVQAPGHLRLIRAGRRVRQGRGGGSRGCRRCRV
jgi:hypothetical protein